MTFTPDDVRAIADELMTLIDSKRCAKCGETKPLDEFSAHGKSSDGKQSYCRECGYEYRRAWASANPDKVKESQRRYRERHADEIREYNREYRDLNHEKCKQQQRDRALAHGIYPGFKSADELDDLLAHNHLGTTIGAV